MIQYFKTRGISDILELALNPQEKDSDSILLNDAFDFIKLNYNCPTSEKTGKGPGSCSNGSNTNSLELLDSDKNYFTLAEKDAINGYTQLGYHYINDFLRGKSHDDMPVRAIKIQENLDKAFQKAFLPKEMTVYSGLGRSGTDAIKNMKNDLFSYTGYISTSKSLDTSALFASTTEPRILEIRLPKNAPAIDLNDQKISANPEEDEVLINTGTIFKRIGIRTEEHKVSSYKNPQKFIIETWQALPRKEIKKIWENDFSGNAIKQYSSYLSEVTEFMKLNYNCPDSEKVGSGKGSCSNGTIESNKTLSNKEKDVVTTFVHDTWMSIHKILTNQPLSDQDMIPGKTEKDLRDEISALDNIMKSSKLETEQLVFSGLSPRVSKQLMQMKVGDTFPSNGYMFTTKDRDIAEEFVLLKNGPKDMKNAVVLQLVIPTDVNALELDPIVPSPEKAILLDRGYTFQISEVLPSGKYRRGNQILQRNTNIIKAKIIKKT